MGENFRDEARRRGTRGRRAAARPLRRTARGPLQRDGRPRHRGRPGRGGADRRAVGTRRSPITACSARKGHAGQADAAAPYCWLIDPLDGTTNYAHGFPHFAVSIGLEQAGVPIIGVVYDPMRDELFAAERGKGATLNGQPIRVSATDRAGPLVAGHRLLVRPGAPVAANRRLAVPDRSGPGNPADRFVGAQPLLHRRRSAGRLLGALASRPGTSPPARSSSPRRAAA